jgi:hypothetical protein
VVSSLQASQPKCCMHPLPPPCSICLEALLTFKGQMTTLVVTESDDQWPKCRLELSTAHRATWTVRFRTVINANKWLPYNRQRSAGPSINTFFATMPLVLFFFYLNLTEISEDASLTATRSKRFYCTVSALYEEVEFSK